MIPSRNELHSMHKTKKLTSVGNELINLALSAIMVSTAFSSTA